MSKYSKFYFDQIKAQVVNINKQFPEDDPYLSFLRLCCSLIFNLNYDDADEIITDEGEDLGADAIHFDVDEEEKRFKIFIIQTKYNKNKCESGNFSTNFSQDIIDKFKNIFDFFASADEGIRVSERVKSKKQDYIAFLDDGYVLDEIYFIASHLGIGFSDNSLEIWNRWLSMNPYKNKIKLLQFGLEDIFKKLEESRTTRIDETISLYGKYFEYTNPDVKGLIGSISANELIKLYEEHGSKIFQKNIRFSLGENIINRKIIESASNQDTRDKFWFLNNGITVVCDDYEKTGTQPEDIKLNVKSFQIVNGTQTTTSIERAFKKVGNVDDVKVLIKIFKASNRLAEMITETTNSQNPVNKRDLRSNDEIQRLIEASLRGIGYYYQRKRNQWSEIPLREKIIDNYDFGQRYLSFYLERPMEAQKQKSIVFIDDETYNKIFNSELKPECIIFIHKSFRELLKQLRHLRKKIREKKKKISNNIIEILPRAKIHLYYSFSVYLENKGFDIKSDKFLSNDKALKEFNEKNTLKLLSVMEKAIKSLANGKEIEYVNVFKKKELAMKIKEIINNNSI